MEKTFILDEIRRCAAENGGVPLGRVRFYAATGVRDTDWSGKFWVRLNDALAEAGFAPNSFNQAHADDHMFGQLAQLVRDLGHYPVQAELQMRHRQDPTFPDAKTFRRAGRKDEVVARLGEWCSAEPGYEDVGAICAQATGRTRRDNEPDDLSDVKAGYVYLLHSNTRGYKIGMTTSMPRRWSEIEGADPDDVELVHYFKTVDAAGIESYWHRRFDAQRRDRGEWFALSSAHVAEFKRRSKSM